MYTQPTNQIPLMIGVKCVTGLIRTKSRSFESPAVQNPPSVRMKLNCYGNKGGRHRSL